MADARVICSIWFCAVLFATGVATFLLHEFAHWFAGVALGHEMTATLNSVSPKGAIGLRDHLIILAAGPLVTIVQALVGFWLALTRRSLFGFALLYIAFFMRLLAAGVSFVNVNDEAKIGQLLGLGTWTLPVLVVASLLGFVVLASRSLELRARDHLVCYAVSSVLVAMIVGVDMVVWPRA